MDIKRKLLKNLESEEKKKEEEAPKETPFDRTQRLNKELELKHEAYRENLWKDLIENCDNRNPKKKKTDRGDMYK